MVSNYAYYSKDPTLWEEPSKALWGGHDICPLLPQFMVTLITRQEISILSHKEAWGDAKRFQSELAFLLILPERVIEGELAFGLAVVWVHPYQTHLPSPEEAVRKLALITPSRENWVYAFAHFNDDAQYTPSLKKIT